jgi:hypothetical protein
MNLLVASESHWMPRIERTFSDYYKNGIVML